MSCDTIHPQKNLALPAPAGGFACWAAVTRSFVPHSDLRSNLVARSLWRSLHFGLSEKQSSRNTFDRGLSRATPKNSRIRCIIVPVKIRCQQIFRITRQALPDRQESIGPDTSQRESLGRPTREERFITGETRFFGLLKCPGSAGPSKPGRLMLKVLRERVGGNRDDFRRGRQIRAKNVEVGFLGSRQIKFDDEQSGLNSLTGINGRPEILGMSR